MKFAPAPWLSTGLLLCGLLSGLFAAPIDPETVIVTVNGTPILEREILAEADERINIYAAESLAKGLVYEESSRDLTRAHYRDQVIEVLIGRVLTAEQLKADGVEITEADVDAAFLAKAREKGHTLAQAAQEIAEQGKSMRAVRERLRWNNLAIRKLYELHDPRKRHFSPAEARFVYDANPGNYRQEYERRVSRILVVAVADHDAEHHKAAKAKAEALLQRVKAGEDFAELARTCSEDELTRKRGGDRGWSPRGYVTAPGNDPFGDAAFALQTIGDVSDVVKTLDGYEIIKLTGIREERQKTFEEVKNEIIAQKDYYYIGAFWDSFAANMKQKARIEWNPGEIARKEEKDRREKEFLAKQAAEAPPEALPFTQVAQPPPEAPRPPDFVRKLPGR